MAAFQPVSLSSSEKLEIKHILVATDFSDCSNHALMQAAAIARLHGSDILVVHAIPAEAMLQQALEPPLWEYQDIVRKAQSQMEVAETSEVLDGISHELLVEQGPLESVLARVIEDRNISMLVLGTRGRGGFKKLLLGSVAEEIFRIAQCPVLTVGPAESPALRSHGCFQSILFATDFSQGSLRALPYAVGLAKESRSMLTLMHVVEEGSVMALYLHERMLADARQRLKELVIQHAIDVSPQPEIAVVSGYPADEILRTADRRDADLIVMGVHKSGEVGAKTSAHLPWTIAQMVVSHAKCPVLTVRG